MEHCYVTAMSSKTNLTILVCERDRLREVISKFIIVMYNVISVRILSKNYMNYGFNMLLLN